MICNLLIIRDYSYLCIYKAENYSTLILKYRSLSSLPETCTFSQTDRAIGGPCRLARAIHLSVWLCKATGNGDCSASSAFYGEPEFSHKV